MAIDIGALTGYSSNTNQQQASSNQLSADMNTFLTLLTTQLKHQDPLDPMDTADFTNQLVQYSAVEQAIQTNTKLENLLTLNVANLGAQAVSYIGKTAQVLGDVMPLDGGKAKATYVLDKDVKSVVINVKDMDGKIVYSEQGKINAGSHDFEWDGKDSSGVQLEDGAYQIQISASVADGESKADVVTTVFGKVTAVASGDGVIYVGLGDAVTSVLGDILTVREDDYFNKESPAPEEGENSSEEAEGESPSVEPLSALMNTLSSLAETAANVTGYGLF